MFVVEAIEDQDLINHDPVNDCAGDPARDLINDIIDAADGIHLNGMTNEVITPPGATHQVDIGLL